MKLLKYVLGGLAVAAAVGTGVVVYKWWKGRGQVRNHFAPAFFPFRARCSIQEMKYALSNITSLLRR